MGLHTGPGSRPDGGPHSRPDSGPDGGSDGDYFVVIFIFRFQKGDREKEQTRRHKREAAETKKS